MIRAPGDQSLTTHIFRDAHASLDPDGVFGVRAPLVGDQVEHAPGATPGGGVVDTPYFTLDPAFVLARST